MISSFVALSPDSVIETQHAYVDIGKPGDLSTLKWYEASPWSTDDKDITRCQIAYNALNFKDIMLATGRLPADSIPGDLSEAILVRVQYSFKTSLWNLAIRIEGPVS